MSLRHTPPPRASCPLDQGLRATLLDTVTDRSSTTAQPPPAHQRAWPTPAVPRTTGATRRCRCWQRGAEPASTSDCVDRLHGMTQGAHQRLTSSLARTHVETPEAPTINPQP